MARTESAADLLGFAVPKDIQNNPVREVDHARQREMWWSVLGVAFLVAGLLLAAWQHFEWRRLGYRLEQLQQQRAAEDSTSRRLHLELAALTSPERIEQLAVTELHLVAPTQTEAVVIERVREAARPARTLVARR